MKKNLRYWTVAAVGAAAAFVVSSCAYDPYYGGSTTVGGSYSTGGYGQGYGYGGSGFSTSLFVSTGDPRWGYDPHTYSYYDYRSRRFYDPYLHGYYPIGYRPPVIIGIPHPYGWRPGSRYIRPPHYIRDTVVVNYRDRVGAYRGSRYDWAKQVRPHSGPRVEERRSQRNYSTPVQEPRTEIRRSGGSRVMQGAPTRAQETRTSTRQSQGSRVPSYYNTPISRPAQERAESRSGSRTEARVESRSESRQPPIANSRGGQRQPAPEARRGQERREEAHAEAEERRSNRPFGRR